MHLGSIDQNNQYPPWQSSTIPLSSVEFYHSRLDSGRSLEAERGENSHHLAGYTSATEQAQHSSFDPSKRHGPVFNCSQRPFFHCKLTRLSRHIYSQDNETSQSCLSWNVDVAFWNKLDKTAVKIKMTCYTFSIQPAVQQHNTFFILTTNKIATHSPYSKRKFSIRTVTQNPTHTPYRVSQDITMLVRNKKKYQQR